MRVFVSSVFTNDASLAVGLLVMLSAICKHYYANMYVLNKDVYTVCVYLFCC